MHPVGAVAPPTPQPVAPRDPDRRVWAVTGVLAVLSVALFAGPVARLPASGVLGPVEIPLWVLALTFVLAERTMMWVRAGKGQGIGLTLSDIPLVIGLFCAGPLVLLGARMVGTLSDVVARGRVSPRKDAFNLALHALGVALAALTWHLVVGDADRLGPRAWVATLTAVGVAEFVTAVAIAVVIWADTRDFDLDPARIGWEMLVALGAGCFGLVFVYVLAADPRAVWLPLVVTLVLYVAHRSYAALQRRNQDVESVSEFTSRLGEFLDVQSVVEETLRTLRTDMGSEVAELFLETSTAEAVVWRLDPRETDEVQEVPLERSVIGRLDPPFDEALVLPSSLRTVRARLPRRAGVRDAVSVPVMREGVPVGTALVADRDDTARSFSRGDIPQLQALANHASTALHNAGLTEALRTSLTEREHQATHDELTGLPNRRAFVDLLLTRVEDGTPSTVAMIDLDRFHDINDVLGAGTGDVLLGLVAERLLQIFGEHHVARLGSDDFAVVLDGTPDRLIPTLRDARERIQHNLVLGEVDLSPSVSIGVAAMLPGEEAGAALAHADLALRRAKNDGSGIVQYDPRVDRATVDRLTLLVDLRQAVEAGTLGVAFQPQVRVEDNQVIGFEALCRWTHPRRGFVPPDEFIPLAEQGGLMMPLTLFVLDEALGRVAAWRTLPGHEDLGVSVNVSPRTLIDPDLLVQVRRILDLHGVPAAALTVEITESDIMAEPERAVAALQRLHDLGIRLSVDDLGTGYSSLAYLSRFPLDELKIDKSFVFDLVDDPATEAVVDAVIGLGRRLGRTVVAEGVEDRATWTRLRVLGCDVVQGYLLSRPMPPQDVPEWLESWNGVRSISAVPDAAGPEDPAVRSDASRAL